MRTQRISILTSILIGSSLLVLGATAATAAPQARPHDELWPFLDSASCSAPAAGVPARHTTPRRSLTDRAPLQTSGSGPVALGSALQDPVMSWAFDEEGLAAPADGPWGATAELTEGCGRTTGVSGLALELDGVSDYGSLPPESGILDDISSLSTGSLSMWFRFDSVPPFAQIQPIFYVGSGLGGQESSYIELEIGHFDSNSYLYFTILSGYILQDDGTYTHHIPLCIRTQQELDPNRWYHVAITMDEGANHIYIDGEELTPPYYPFGDGQTRAFYSNIWTTNVAWFGRGILGSIDTEQYLDGAIDDVQLHDRILSASEVSDYVNDIQQSAHVTFDASMPDTCFGTVTLTGSADGVASLGWRVDEGSVTEIDPALAWSIDPSVPPGHHTIEVMMEDHFGVLHSDTVEIANVDLNADGIMAIDDLLVLLGGWGEANSSIDLTGDETVDIADLLVMLGAWPL